jgi:hypothetical protein
MRELSEVLNLELFGVGQAKTFDELQAEIACGESEIIWENDRPIRLVQVAYIEVVSHSGEMLLEERQEFADGRIRRRKLMGVSEKLQAGETPIAAAHRALVEELGIETELVTELVIASIRETVDEKISASYPGLLSRYHRYHFRVVLPASLYQSCYVEEQTNKKTFFCWRPLDD